MLGRRSEIETEMSANGFWNDSDTAQATVTELKRLKTRLSPVQSMDAKLDELDVMIELVGDGPSAENVAESEVLLDSVMAAMGTLEFRVMLAGEYDMRNAYLSVQAGAGGTESCDWAEMLYRMVMRFCERNEYDVNLVEYQPGDEAGIKSVTLTVDGPNAYGHLKSENGVHRLVRISPFDSQARRHTAFASVSVFPELDDAIEVEIDENDYFIIRHTGGTTGDTGSL